MFNHAHTGFIDTGGTAFAAFQDVTGATHADDTPEGAHAGTPGKGSAINAP